jgi:glutamine cyclotransferase
MGDRIYQLTWQSHLGFVYDKTSLELIRTFEYPTEGWGLTHDGSRLIMSDGTATLRFLDPVSLSETRQVTVFEGWTPVTPERA